MRRVVARPIPLALAAAALVAWHVASPAAHSARAHDAAAKRSFNATFAYTDTSTGPKLRTGHGSFSGKLRGHAAAMVRMFAAAAGVPYSAIAKGGSYAVRFHTASNGDNVGLFAARFRTRSLGSGCVSYRETHGQFVSGFVPTSGSFKMLGGTGKFAHVRVCGTFRVTNIVGAEKEIFSATGALKASLGAAKPLSRACRALAKSL